MDAVLPMPNVPPPSRVCMPAWALEVEARLLMGKTSMPTDRYWADPALILKDAKLEPDPWQPNLLHSSADRILLLCSRQAGKSQSVAAVALKTALLEPGSLVLLLSPTLRQSGELFRDKVLTLYNALGCPVRPLRKPTQLMLELVNGSRIVSLPENSGEGAPIWTENQDLHFNRLCKAKELLPHFKVPEVHGVRVRPDGKGSPVGAQRHLTDIAVAVKTRSQACRRRVRRGVRLSTSQ
jgi:hypothetical protein